MGLLFCCPTCGASLRVNPAAASLISCPGCGEPIRVPRRPHPLEAATDTPTLPDGVRAGALTAVRRLFASVLVFAAGYGIVLGSVALRLCFAPPLDEPYPDWLPPVQLTLAGWWLLLGLCGCCLRWAGYAVLHPAAVHFGSIHWRKAATTGAWLSAVGVLALVPGVIGRPLMDLSLAARAVVLIGLACGLVGVALEFAILVVLNRLLWETAGWQAAAATGRYAVAFVFGVVAAVGCVCVGMMAVVLTFGGSEVAVRPPAGLPTEVKVIGGLILLGVGGCGGYLGWRFARLLLLTRKALLLPEPTADKPVASGG